RRSRPARTAWPRGRRRERARGGRDRRTTRQASRRLSSLSITSDGVAYDGGAAMFTLLHGGHVFDPEGRGRMDVLVCHQSIGAMAPSVDATGLPAPVTIVDASALRVAPGFVDAHIHLIGGGGAEGFETRLPELWLSDLARAGITTAVGAPGVDTASKR